MPIQKPGMSPLKLLVKAKENCKTLSACTGQEIMYKDCNVM